jgi:hypothetical protein
MWCVRAHVHGVVIDGDERYDLPIFRKARVRRTGQGRGSRHSLADLAPLSLPSTVTSTVSGITSPICPQCCGRTEVCAWETRLKVPPGQRGTHGNQKKTPAQTA